MEISFFSDLKLAVFRPQEFINSRFLTTPRARIERLGFSAMMFGLVAGNLISLALCFMAAKSFLQNPEPYIEALKSLGINQEGFVELIAVAVHLFHGSPYLWWTLIFALLDSDATFARKT
jgi:hypothetical protein